MLLMGLLKCTCGNGYFAISSYMRIVKQVLKRLGVLLTIKRLLTVQSFA